MQIVIKVLKGEDCTLEVEPSTSIVEIKQQIEAKLKFPVATQKLLIAGRTLNNENVLSSYPNIKDGSKLHLVVMKPESLRDLIHRGFRKHYSEQDATRLTQTFMQNFEQRLRSMSLDDITRLAMTTNYSR